MTFLLISLGLLVPYLALILYYHKSWLQVPTYPQEWQNPGSLSTIITVIIVARNEEKNIGSCLESIVKQAYPASLFELILVDDHSTDATGDIARSFKQSNFNVVDLKDFTGEASLNSYKKKALEAAIGLARGTLIVTTDADCILHPEWLQTIASCYEREHPVFIVAPVVYTNPPGGDPFSKKLLKIFQSLDFMMLQGITAASVFKGFHNMCNGANLCYEKKAFIEARGFRGIDSIASGDDMLLMHKIHGRHPTGIKYLKSTNVVVQTQPAETLKDFMNQRIRWASKADKYTDGKILTVLFLVYIFNAWIFFLGVCSFFYRDALYLALLLLMMKTLVELIFLYSVAEFFGKRKLLWLFLPAQPLHIIYTLIAGWLGKFGTYKWKGRKVK